MFELNFKALLTLYPSSSQVMLQKVKRDLKSMFETGMVIGTQLSGVDLEITKDEN